MLNTLWLGMMFLSVIVGLFTDHLNEVVVAVTESAKLAFDLALGLAGILSFWLGIMEVAKESGLIRSLARLLHPLMRRLFPEVPPDDPAMGAMILNIAANMLGLANAATPFGLQAMKELERLNPHPEEASNAMCTFLAINTSSIQLIPTTAIAYLAANGASHPTEVIASSLVATTFSTLVAIITVKHLAKWKYFQPSRGAMQQPLTTLVFLKQGKIPLKKTWILSIAGCLGVLIALPVFNALSTESLHMLLIGVLSYNLFSMGRTYLQARRGSRKWLAAAA